MTYVVQQSALQIILKPDGHKHKHIVDICIRLCYKLDHFESKYQEYFSYNKNKYLYV